MDPLLAHLFPRPRSLLSLSEQLHVRQELWLVLQSRGAGPRRTCQRLADALAELGFSCRWSAVARRAQSDDAIGQISLQINEALFAAPESYRLAVESRGISLVACDEAGLFYGVLTLEQLLRSALEGRKLPALIVSDAPDFRHRGVMLDVSRDKIPTMETLYGLIDAFASWKFNQLQLYVEHSFAYEGHEQVWRGSSPLTGEEILALDAYCKERYIELVPNQNSFGHMHRWLMHEGYKDIAECPEGIQHPFNRRIEPFGLCPIEPKSLEFLADLYGQLLPHFDSPVFNVGFDETFDLGQGRSKERCEAEGTAPVYLEFLRDVAGLARQHGRTIQFWADIVLNHEAHITSIPADAIGMIWGYEADHAFDEQCQALARAGLQFYVCPGTSSWNTFGGRTDNALGNLENAAKSGSKHGALGYLLTDWGDFGHMQPLPVSYLGFLAGAGYSWNAGGLDGMERADWIALLNRMIFDDPSGVTGQVVYDLGNAYRQTGARSFNASPLFRLLVLAERHSPQDTEQISLESLAANRAYITAAVAPLDRQQMGRDDADLLVRELHWVADVLCYACDFASARLEYGELASLPEPVRRSLVERLEQLMERHRAQWLERNRVGGLEDSVEHLEYVRQMLLK